MNTMKRLVTGAVLAGAAVLGSVTLHLAVQAPVAAADRSHGTVVAASESDGTLHVIIRKPIKDLSG